MVIAKGERVSLSDYPQNLQMVKCPKDMLHIAIDLNYGYFIDFLKENLRSTQKGLTMFLGGNIIVNCWNGLFISNFYIFCAKKRSN